ncbi:MAG: sodium:proton antiporter [Burkholderiaceae bacterium]|nr:sodium:proton antiporter [Burkholderiaceae bacterium]
MDFTIQKIGFLLLIASLVAMMTRRLRVPYSVGLVATGILLAFFLPASNIELTSEVIFTALLPPLVFQASLFLPWHELRKELPVVTLMATIGVVMAAGVTAAGMHYLVGWPWLSAMAFGALIAATDPVSVVATFSEAGVKGRLRILVESESLLNDGTAAVMLGIVLTAALGHEMSVSEVVTKILFTVGGGIVCGAAIAGAVLYLSSKTGDHLIEITLTTIAAYGSFMLAEHFHMSGVLAAMTAGLIFGNSHAYQAITNKGREAVEAFWDYAAFLANSFVFLLIGMREAQQDFSNLWLPALIAIVLVTAGRAVAIYPVTALFSQSMRPVKMAHQHILFWGGLRGALALALALGLPDSIPFRDEIVTLSFAVVAFSIVVQGMTIKPLMGWLGELKAKVNSRKGMS